MAEKEALKDRIGPGLARIRLFTGGPAADTAERLNANAFTVGANVAFARGAYAPGTAGGLRLLAHEVAHSAQQRFGDGPLVIQCQDRTESAPESDDLEELHTRMDQMDARQRVHLVLNEFQSAVQSRAASWQRAALQIGSAYAAAVERHRTAIQEQERQDALREAAFYGVLTAATVGGLSWVSSLRQAQGALQAAQRAASAPSPTVLGRARLGSTVLSRPADLDIGDLITNSSEDAVQALAGEGIDLHQSATAPRRRAASQIPLVFQNELHDRILASIEDANDRFAGLYRDLQTTPLDEFDEGMVASVRAVQENWLRNTDDYVGADQLPGSHAMSRELERGIWARWAPNLRRMIQHSPTRAPLRPGVRPVVRYIWRDPGSHLEARFNALGITEAAGIGADFGIWTFDEETEALYNYLMSYQVQSLLEAEE